MNDRKANEKKNNGADCRLPSNAIRARQNKTFYFTVAFTFLLLNKQECDSCYLFFFRNKKKNRLGIKKAINSFLKRKKWTRLFCGELAEKKAGGSAETR